MNWLSCKNHAEIRDWLTAGMGMNMNVISTSVNLPACMSIEDIQAATHEDAHLQEWGAYTIQGWSHKKEEMDHSMRQYWPIREKLAMIDCFVIRGKRILIPFEIQKQILQQWHSNPIGIGKLRLLVHESVC